MSDDGRVVHRVGGIAGEVRVLFRLGQREQVVVLDAGRVTLDQRGQGEVFALGLDRVVELGQVEVLVLERVRELVHDGDAHVDIGEVGAAHVQRLALLVVEADGVGGTEIAFRLDQVDGPFDEPDRAELAGDALGFDAVLLRDLRIVALVRLHERGVGEELDAHRVVELQLPVLLDERHVLRDPGIPSFR